MAILPEKKSNSTITVIEIFKIQRLLFEIEFDCTIEKSRVDSQKFSINKVVSTQL